MNKDCVYIHGLGLSSYRSFPKDIQQIYPFKKVNLFIGRNNSGKSNILNFLYKHYLPIFRGEDINFDNVDYHDFKLFQKNEIQTNFYFFTPNKGWKDELIQNYKSRTSEKISTTRASRSNSMDHNSQFDNWNGTALDPRIADLNRADRKSQDNREKVQILQKILAYLELTLLNQNSYYWIINQKYSIGSYFKFKDLEINDLEKKIFPPHGINSEYLKEIYFAIKKIELEGRKNLTKITKNDEAKRNINNYLEEILSYICDFILDYSGYFKKDFKISLIPAIREVGNPGTTFDENRFSGEGLIDELAKLQHPDNHLEQHKKQQFEKINQFLRTVTDNESAKIEIPHDKSKILVEMDGKILPLQSLGTGIHEVIILAAAATIKENQVICMEEPELHLHPLLQKKLITYLQKETNNQYFITTHSAHFLDTSDVSIFHVSYENGCSIINRVETDNHKITVLSDLGYKPSDLLQTNCVIWVEGPSDRIYLNYWIQCFSPELKEKIHYTIMFYGGGLLSHLSVSDSEDEDDLEQNLTDFISLLKINRNTVIMCDSDKGNENDSLKPAIERIKAEFENTEFQGFHWITDGREVENYLNPDIVEEIIKENHRNVDKISGKKRYSFFWKYKSSKIKKSLNADKIKLARELVKSYPVSKENFEKITNSSIKIELEGWLEKLIHFICKSNGIQIT